jgi:hypothetical protein
MFLQTAMESTDIYWIPIYEPGLEAYLDQQRQRALPSLHRLAHKLGFQVVPDSLPAVS